MSKTKSGSRRTKEIHTDEQAEMILPLPGFRKAAAVPAEPVLPEPLGPVVSIERNFFDLVEQDADRLDLKLAPAVCTADHFLAVAIHAVDENSDAAGPQLGRWQFTLEGPDRLVLALERTKGRIAPRLLAGAHARKPFAARVFDRFEIAGKERLLAHLEVFAQGNMACPMFVSTANLHLSQSARAADEGQRRELNEVPPRLRTVTRPWFAWPAQARVFVAARHVAGPHDPVGRFVLDTHRLFRANDIPCQLHAGYVFPGQLGPVRPIEEIIEQAGPRDLLVYHFSTYEPELDRLLALPCRKLLYYHNLTPWRFFREYDQDRESRHMKALEQLTQFPAFEGLVASSWKTIHDLEENLAARAYGPEREPLRREAIAALNQLHLRELAVCPPVLGANLANCPEEKAKLPEASSRLVHVGDLFPNRRIEDLVHLFAEYRKLDAAAQLVIAATGGMATYRRRIERVIAALDADTRSRIVVLDRLGDGQLVSIYKQASAFVTMSEHEGYCGPLVDAMGLGVPVFAFAEPAVRETLGRTGLVIHDKDLPHAAAVLQRFLRDDEWRRQVIATQTQRYQELAGKSDGRLFWQAIEQVLFAPAAERDRPAETVRLART
ncbi:MAG: glycosyltransferase [Gemmataceae bacterium]